MESSEVRERLYQIFFTSENDVEMSIQHALEIGQTYLNLQLGFVTEVDDGTQTIAYVSGEDENIKPGNQCPLEEAYCRRTIEMDSALAVQDVTASQAIGPEAELRFGLSTYIGAKILVDDATYGTACFASKEGRETGFTDAEETFVELLARLIGQTLEREQFEEELREQRDRFEAIADATFDLLFRIDLDGQFTYMSSASERILGYSPEEMIGQSFVTYLTAESAPTAVSAYEGVLDGAEIHNVELELLTADGETVVIEVNGSPAFEDGEIVGILGVGRDITARKDAQRQLEIRDKAIDEARVGVTLADTAQADDPLVYVNQGFKEITGYDGPAATGRNCRFLQGEETDPETVATIREGIDTQEPVVAELVNYRRDGTPFWNQLRITPVRNGSGDVTHLLGIQTDITEQKRWEQLVEVLNRVLRHNLRNDMGVISGLSELIASTEGDEVMELGETIKARADRLLELTETAQQLKATASREAIPKRLSPESLLQEVSEPYDDHGSAVTITTNVETTRDICAGAELREALTELLENAVKHNSARSPRVRIAVRDEAEWIELTIEDNGPGINEMEANVIANGEEEPLEHGSGLGLWLINWIVTRYGGSFQIHPRSDGETGTRAHLRLPAITEEMAIEDAAKRATILFW
jgi:PAS domain S-box-containing protein